MAALICLVTKGLNSFYFILLQSDSTNIKNNHIPILTEQFAPVENLLNPITKKPYDIEKKEKKERKELETNSFENWLNLFCWLS